MRTPDIIRLNVEYLEDRLAPAVADLTASEQYFLELINRGRANPALEAQRLGIDLNEGLAPGTLPGSAVQPLASNDLLQYSADGHIGYLRSIQRLTHSGPDGSTSGQRATRAGYTWRGVGENLAYNAHIAGYPTETVDTLYRQLFVDAGVAGRGHRITMLEPRYQELGVALSTVPMSWGTAEFVVQEFGTRGTGRMITGVTYTDSVLADSFYTIGEGIAGVTVTAISGTGQSYTTTSTSSGGYSLEVPAGSYSVVFATPDGRTGAQSVSVGDTNVKVDFVPGQGAVPPPEPEVTATSPLKVAVAVGAPAGGSGAVRVLQPQNGQHAWTVNGAVPQGIGARVAIADVNNDGYDDLIVGTGPGVASKVRIFSGATRTELYTITPFEASFLGGVYVAAGDITGDGRADVIVTPDEGGGPRVRAFSGQGMASIADFYGIDDPNFRGGARAAVGDINRDGHADVVVAAGFMGGPRIAGFSGQALTQGRTERLFADFYAFEQTLRNGVFVTLGDVNGDGYADLVAGGGPGGGPRVSILSGRDLLANRSTSIASFFGGDPDSRDGVRLTAKDLDNDGRADVIVGVGSRATAYAGRTLSPTAAPGVVFDVNAFPGFNGVFVG